MYFDYVSWYIVIFYSPGIRRSDSVLVESSDFMLFSYSKDEISIFFYH